MKRPVRAVIPVAGLGTRMHPLSRAVPKELLPLGRKPVLHHVVSELAAGGVTTIELIISQRTSAIERYFADDPRLDAALRQAGMDDRWTAGDERLSELTFQFVRQEEALGIADAVHRSRAFVGGHAFFLHMGDSVMTGDPDLLERMTIAHERSNAVCTIAIQKMTESQIRSHGTVVARGDASSDVFEIDEIVEKPQENEIVVGAGLTGRYLISAPMLAAVSRPEPRRSPFGCLGGIFPDRDSLTGPVQAIWCKPGAKLHDTGNLDSYLMAQVFFAFRDERVGRETRETAKGDE
jgi:UTP--glucose-1-phosphate uridylyltransferase